MNAGLLLILLALTQAVLIFGVPKPAPTWINIARLVCALGALACLGVMFLKERADAKERK